MRTIMADKISSVAQYAQLSRELRLGDDIPCEEGVLVAAEILTNKGTYNTMELTSGRQARLKRGDIIVGALGHRNALFGYAGHLPEKVEVGDVLQVLNMGGVMGVCDSINPKLGPPFDVRILGVVLDFPYLGERIGVPARAGAERLDPGAALDVQGVPVVALAGTCMNSGKTFAACAIISRLRHMGLVVDAFKSTGVALRRDILAMEDAGARNTMIFSDFGVVSTTEKTGPAVTRTILSRLAEGRPDVIVFELGDGILGAYGVEAILKEPAIRDALSCVVLSANDPVAAWGGVELLRKDFGIDPKVVTGPATDNEVGRKIISERCGGVPAINAITDAAAIGDAVARSIGLEAKA